MKIVLTILAVLVAAGPAVARNEFELRSRPDLSRHRHGNRVHFERVIIVPNAGFNRFNGELPGGFDRDVDRSNSGSPSFPYNPVSGESRGLLDR